MAYHTASYSNFKSLALRYSLLIYGASPSRHGSVWPSAFYLLCNGYSYNGAKRLRVAPRYSANLIPARALHMLPGNSHICVQSCKRGKL